MESSLGIEEVRTSSRPRGPISSRKPPREEVRSQTRRCGGGRSSPRDPLPQGPEPDKPSHPADLPPDGKDHPPDPEDLRVRRASTPPPARASSPAPSADRWNSDGRRDAGLSRPHRHPHRSRVAAALPPTLRKGPARRAATPKAARSLILSIRPFSAEEDPPRGFGAYPRDPDELREGGTVRVDRLLEARPGDGHLRIAVGEIPRVVEGGRYLPFVELIDPIEPVYLVEAVLPPCWGPSPDPRRPSPREGEGGEVDPASGSGRRTRGGGGRRSLGLSPRPPHTIWVVWPAGKATYREMSWMYLCLARMSLSYSFEGQSSAILALEGASGSLRPDRRVPSPLRTCSFEEPGRILRWT